MIRVGLGNVRIKGLSGRTYTFRAYPLETRFAEFGAVYFITGRRLDSKGRTSHSRIYCGQTSNLSVCPYTAEQLASFQKYDANCICILPVQGDASRGEIEQDIHQYYKLLSGS